MTAEQPAVAIRNVNFSYGDGLTLENVTLNINDRDFLGIIGPNGSGKTTLLKLMLGLLQPCSGTVKVLGRTPCDSRTEMGYVPQFASFPRDFPVSVLDVVLMGLLSKASSFGPYRRAEREKAHQALATVNVDLLAKHRIGNLSGGQLQRVLLARALVNDPRILLLDEPTSNIDAKAEESFFDLLHRLNEQVTVVLVSHDLGFITSHVNRVACINRQLVCHPTEEITSDVIARLYDTPVDMVQHHHHLPDQENG